MQRRAEGWRRLAAFALDYLLIVVYLLALTLVSALVSLSGGQAFWDWLFASPLLAEIAVFAMTVLPVALYFALFESSPRAATPGKRRLGLLVVGVGGAPPSRARALVRALTKLLPWQLAHSAMLQVPGFPKAPEPGALSNALLVATWLLVGVYLLGLSPLAKRRTLYDLVTGTVVVRDDASLREDCRG